jgi:hypothetical protein
MNRERMGKIGVRGKPLVHDRVRPGGSDAARRKPLRSPQVRAWQPRGNADVALFVLPIVSPTGADQYDIAGSYSYPRLCLRARQVVRCYSLRWRQGRNTTHAGDIEEHPPARKGSSQIDAEGTISVPSMRGGRRVGSTMEPTTAPDVAESIDMRAAVAGEHDEFVGAVMRVGLMDLVVVAVQQTEQVWRVKGVVRHPPKQGAAEVVDLRGGEKIARVARTHALSPPLLVRERPDVGRMAPRTLLPTLSHNRPRSAGGSRRWEDARPSTDP